MSIQIGKYTADGPFGNVRDLKTASGVYVVLGRGRGASTWIVVDVGESANVRERVSTHDREPCWRRQGHAELAFAVIYADQQTRMRIERELRAEFKPPCGEV